MVRLWLPRYRSLPNRCRVEEWLKIIQRNFSLLHRGLHDLVHVVLSQEASLLRPALIWV